MKMSRILRWSHPLVFLFLAIGAIGQSVETVNGVRLVHNGKEGQWGRKPKGQGDFSYPDSIDIDGEDMVWVSDPNNQRIQVLTPEGAERKTLSFVKERVGKIRRTKSGLLLGGGGGD